MAAHLDMNFVQQIHTKVLRDSQLAEFENAKMLIGGPAVNSVWTFIVQWVSNPNRLIVQLYLYFVFLVVSCIFFSCLKS